MTNTERTLAALTLALIAALVAAWWLWRRERAQRTEPASAEQAAPIELSATYPVEGRDYIDVPGVGRVLLEHDKETRDRWEQWARDRVKQAEEADHDNGNLF